MAGLYWRAGQPGGIAHASIGTVAGGISDLGSTGGASRANGTNYDGSVVVGWDEAADGHWRSVVWVNGVQTILHDLGAFTEAQAVNGAGNVIVGDAWNNDTGSREAAAWHWNGASWDEEILGTLPGTFPGFGHAVATGVSDDGSVIVGFNRYDFGPFSDSTGFIWTEVLGMVSIEEYLTSHGVVPDPMFDFGNVTGVSADGKTLIGYGTDLNTFQTLSFAVTIPAPSALALTASSSATSASRLIPALSGAATGNAGPGCAPAMPDPPMSRTAERASTLVMDILFAPATSSPHRSSSERPEPYVPRRLA